MTLLIPNCYVHGQLVPPEPGGAPMGVVQGVPQWPGAECTNGTAAAEVPALFLVEPNSRGA